MVIAVLLLFNSVKSLQLTAEIRGGCGFTGASEETSTFSYLVFSQLASLCLSLYPWRDTGRDKFHIVWKQLECAEAARLWGQCWKSRITETTWNGDLLLIFTKIWKIKAFIAMGIVDIRSVIKFYKGSVFYHYQRVPPLLIFTSHNQVNKSTWLVIIIRKPY